MEVLTPFVICGCSLCLNFFLVILAACQSSKISKLEDSLNTSDVAYESLREEYLRKHNRLVKAEENLKSAMCTIEEMKQVKAEAPKTAKKATAKKTVKTVKAEATTKTTKRRTTKKEEK